MGRSYKVVASVDSDSPVWGNVLRWRLGCCISSPPAALNLDFIATLPTLQLEMDRGKKGAAVARVSVGFSYLELCKSKGLPSPGAK